MLKEMAMTMTMTMKTSVTDQEKGVYEDSKSHDQLLGELKWHLLQPPPAAPVFASSFRNKQQPFAFVMRNPAIYLVIAHLI